MTMLEPPGEEEEEEEEEFSFGDFGGKQPGKNSEQLYIEI